MFNKKILSFIMKKKLQIFICILLFTSLVNAQSFVIYGDKCFGGSGGEFGNGILKTTDENLILSGSSNSDISGNKIFGNCNPTSSPTTDMWVLKIDSLFNIIWQKDIGGNKGETYPILNSNLTNDKLLLSCHSYSDSSCQKSKNNHKPLGSPNAATDYWVVVLDTNSNIIWEKTIGGDGEDQTPSFIQLTTNEYLICGLSSSNISGDKSSPCSGYNDYWILKLDTLGNIIYDKTLGGNGIEGGFYTYAPSILPIINGEYILGGTTESQLSGNVSVPSKGDWDYWIVKIDNAGNKIWDKRYGGIYLDPCISIIATKDNGFLACGNTLSPQGGDITDPIRGSQANTDYWIVKLDSLGNKQWDKRFGGSGPEYFQSVQKSIDGGFFLVGSSGSNIGYDVSEPVTSGGYWIVKIDSLGNKIWDKRLGNGTALTVGASLVELADSSIMFLGTAGSDTSATKTDPGYGGTDYWAVRFKYFPATVGIDEMNLFNQSVAVFPNPAKDFITINSKNGNIKKIELVNLVGETIYSQQLENTSSSQLNIQTYSPGFYFVKVSNEKYTITKRLVKE